MTPIGAFVRAKGALAPWMYARPLLVHRRHPSQEQHMDALPTRRVLRVGVQVGQEVVSQVWKAAINGRPRSARQIGSSPNA
jgi:hypothetical protein